VGQLSEVARRELKVLYLSSLTMGKGFADVLRAIPLLSDVEGIRYVFAGEYTSPSQARQGRNSLQNWTSGIVSKCSALSMLNARVLSSAPLVSL
jgi:hypothetical protein